MILASAAVLALSGGVAAAQGVIVSPLPTAGLPADGSPEVFLQQAQDALARRQTGVARAALERAETRMLDRSVPPSAVNQPDNAPQIQQIGEARRAIERNDIATARQLISQVLSSGMAAGGGTSGGTMGGSGSGNMGYGSMGSGSMGGGQPPALGTNMPARPGTGTEGSSVETAPAMRR